MKRNATLVIHNANAFANDIWECDCGDDFKWKEVLPSFGDTLQYIYNALEHSETEIVEVDRLYVLGDVINMLRSIDVKCEE